MRTALIIVDMQQDFLPGGALGVPEGDEIILPIYELIHEDEPYDQIVFTRDWHPRDHCSFSNSPLFIDRSWPPHCIQGTDGALLHQELFKSVRNLNLFSKGMKAWKEEYSGFDGIDIWGKQYLNGFLVENAIGAVDVVGLALDYCVKATAIDARRHGFKARVILDCTRPVAQKSGLLAVAEMSKEGVEFV